MKIFVAILLGLFVLGLGSWQFGPEVAVPVVFLVVGVFGLWKDWRARRKVKKVDPWEVPK